MDGRSFAAGAAHGVATKNEEPPAPMASVIASRRSCASMRDISRRKFPFMFCTMALGRCDSIGTVGESAKPCWPIRNWITIHAINSRRARLTLSMPNTTRVHVPIAAAILRHSKPDTCCAQNLRDARRKLRCREQLFGRNREARRFAPLPNLRQHDFRPWLLLLQGNCMESAEPA